MALVIAVQDPSKVKSSAYRLNGHARLGREDGTSRTICAAVQPLAEDDDTGQGSAVRAHSSGISSQTRWVLCQTCSFTR